MLAAVAKSGSALQYGSMDLKANEEVRVAVGMTMKGQKRKRKR